MEKDDSKKIERFFSLKNLPSVLGLEIYITKIKEAFYFKKKSIEVPDSNKLAPEPEKIIQEICRYYHVSSDDLLITRRSWFNKPRNIAIYLIRLMCNEWLTSIAERFSMNTYSAVSSIIQRVGDLRKKDKKICKEIDLLVKKIIKIQEKV